MLVNPAGAKELIRECCINAVTLADKFVYSHCLFARYFI